MSPELSQLPNSPEPFGKEKTRGTSQDVPLVLLPPAMVEMPLYGKLAVSFATILSKIA